MVSLELFAGIIGISVLLAVFVPLTFDNADITGGLQNVTKALCNIDVMFLGNSTLVQCTQPDDTFDLIAGTGIILTANNTEKKIIINSTGGGTVIPTQICSATEFFDAFFSGNSTFRCTPTSQGSFTFMNNTGTGIELFKNKTSDTFFIKTLVGIGGITITNSTDEVFINGTDVQAIFTNLGDGAEVFKNKTGTDVFFRTLENGTGITIVQNDEEIVFSTIPRIHNNLGNGSEVFKNETNTQVNLRSIIENFPVNVTQFTNEIEVDLDDASVNGTLIVWNSTLNEWEFQTPDDFQANSGFDNTEFFYPHLCVGEASDPIKPFTEYKTRAVEYDKPKDCNWQFIVPRNIQVIGDLEIEYWWYVDKNSTATVCMQTSFLPLALMEDIDGTFASQKEFCEPISMDIDNLQVNIVSWTPAEHALIQGDLVFVKIEREDPNPSDTYGDPAWLLGAQVRWVT